MTPADLSRLETLAREATPGPWFHRQPFMKSKVGEWDWYDWVSNKPENTPGFVHVVSRGNKPKDYAYIAAANPAAVLALIARVRELEAKAQDND